MNEIQDYRQTAKGTKAIAYLRVSSKGQSASDRDGYRRQRKLISEYATAQKMVLLQEYQDDVSGTLELVERPGLSALFERVICNGVRVVLIENASRLARDLIVSELILSEFRKQGISVITADSGTDLTSEENNDPTTVLIRQVLGAVSQFEKSQVVLKLRCARDRKRREQGVCEGRKPFGASPGEEEALQRLRVLYRKPRGQGRRSMSEIARMMNVEEWPTRTGVPWSRQSVRAILQRK